MLHLKEEPVEVSIGILHYSILYFQSLEFIFIDRKCFFVLIF
jgi:hypothetical protein